MTPAWVAVPHDTVSRIYRRLWALAIVFPNFSCGAHSVLEHAVVEGTYGVSAPRDRTLQRLQQLERRAYQLQFLHGDLYGVYVEMLHGEPMRLGEIQ